MAAVCRSTVFCLTVCYIEWLQSVGAQCSVLQFVTLNGCSLSQHSVLSYSLLHWMAAACRSTVFCLTVCYIEWLQSVAAQCSVLQFVTLNGCRLSEHSVLSYSLLHWMAAACRSTLFCLTVRYIEWLLSVAAQCSLLQFVTLNGCSLSEHSVLSYSLLHWMAAVCRSTVFCLTVCCIEWLQPVAAQCSVLQFVTLKSEIYGPKWQ